MMTLENKVLAEVEKMVDFETGLTIGQMEMIQSVRETETGVVKIDFMPTSPFCPMTIKLAIDIKRTA